MENQAIVIDNGSISIKSGFSGDDSPTSVFPNVVGRLKYPGMSKRDETFNGDEYDARRGILISHYPIKKGKITNFKDCKTIWEKCYHELRITDEEQCEHPLLITDHPDNFFERKKMTEIMFEEYKVPALSIGNSGTLALYSYGSCYGVVVDIGSRTTATPVDKTNVGGDDITKYMQSLLTQKDNLFKPTSNGHYEIVKDIKEKTGYIASDYEWEISKSQLSSINIQNLRYHQYLKNLYDIFDVYRPFFKILNPDVIGYIHRFVFEPIEKKKYNLPDGDCIDVSDSRFKAPEILFKPYLIGKEEKGIVDLVLSSIDKCDTDLKKDLYSKIYLSGGSSLFKGIVPRLKEDLKKELISRDNPNINIRINASKERKKSTWVGGSIVASLSSFQNYSWVTKEEYDNCGSSIALRKFF